MVVVVETISRVVENKQLFGVRQSMCNRHTEKTLQYASIQMQGWTRIACKAASEQKKKRKDVLKDMHRLGIGDTVVENLRVLVSGM